MRLAVIADIHGNRPALEAVLEDISRFGADATVNLGDVVSGPIDPRGTIALLREAGFPTVRGNHDRTVLGGADDPVDRWTRAQLSAADLDWLAAIPPTLTFADDVFLCHGTPASDSVPWLETWIDDGAGVVADEASVARHAEGFDYPVLLCGHTHVARVARLADGRMIANPGSVGLQFFYGAPDARYAVLERRAGAWSATIRMVPYDHEEAARLAEASGFPAWRRALTTGWAGPRALFGVAPKD